VSDILSDLNDEQRRAVLHTKGPLLVLAGAGTGKTRVITCRIAHLLAEGVAAKNLLAVTFTNKAAREMRERVAALVGAARAKELTVSTFHSFCVRILREHGEKIDLPRGFGICDESDQLTAAKNALREQRIPEASVHPKAALAKISLFKNRLVSPAQALAEATDDFEELVARTYRAYNDHLRRSRTVDFDDLLLLTDALLSSNTSVRKKLQDRYRYILVDEYQDTNGPQYEILRRLAEKHRNLCVVGDDDQSIYGWRGADVRKILGFERDFPGTTVVRLETNYRSTQPILDAANALILRNRSRHEKTLRASCGPGPPVRVLPLEDEEHEAVCVVDEIAEEVRAGRASLGDFAILFRTAVQPRTFEGRLRAARLPYEVVGGMSFFDRKEVRDVLAYLRSASNPEDEASLLRVVNVPPRGVGKTKVERALEAAAKEGVSVARIFEREEIARDFRRILADLAPRLPSPQAIRELLVAVRYADELDRCYPDAIARQARWAAVEEILNLAENYGRRTKSPTLLGFLEELTLAAEEPEEEDEERSRDRVMLMTLHSSKGLEFPRVYLVGVEERILPHEKSIAENGVEEERRLMYVGITRARRRLTITYVRSRAKYGRREPCQPSRFLFEMGGEPPPSQATSRAGLGRPPETCPPSAESRSGSIPSRDSGGNSPGDTLLRGRTS